MKCSKKYTYLREFALSRKDVVATVISKSDTFILHVLKCLLYPEQCKSIGWSGEVAQRFYEITVLRVKRSNELLKFDTMVKHLYTFLYTLEGRLEDIVVVPSLMRSYGVHGLIVTHSVVQTIERAMRGSLVGVMHKYYYFDTDKDAFEDLFLEWVYDLARELGYDFVNRRYN